MVPRIAPNHTAIRAARQRRRLAQHVVAELAGISERTYRAIELGHTETVDEQVLHRIADILGEPADTFTNTPSAHARLERLADRFEAAIDRLERMLCRDRR